MIIPLFNTGDLQYQVLIKIRLTLLGWLFNSMTPQVMDQLNLKSFGQKFQMKVSRIATPIKQILTFSCCNRKQ
ncbi:unnamed protein product [Paramecium octaurelia]|uniref:Uncharacterized protein n=1 Tax=Paramecium octaurelia TaxID=43137 RepID=A0A8S1TJ28_PAROT|nr:unnamed protein product [Paramecium octaurelia]